ncbi:O-antigen ligase family protein [Legionella brunensis]|uniref:O-antigen biosynthesis protein n=1 Tax=Legionella brunensis TaxID=29422 RepID=A0A0W0SDZ4_9GAMM|nr:O-antigen ligase family protein [Legionella brunensis]KTC81371.1 O-antigen biosynthesis protein [Legionella brunensis]
MDILLSFSQRLPMQKWVTVLLAATLLTLPMSSTAKSICLSLSLITILLTPAFRKDVVELFSTKWGRACLILFAISLIACFWSPANIADKKFMIAKYSKLLYFPILVAGFQSAKTRQMSLQAFLVAMIITCVLSIFKFHGYLQSFHFNPDHVFRNHIMTGYMVAFAAYISCLFAYRQQGKMRFVYGLLALLFSYQVLFVSGGRTGYIIYLLLMSFFSLQLRTWRQTIFGLSLVFAQVMTSYHTSPVMNERVDGLTQQIQSYQHNQKDTDIGLRLQFHHYAYQLFNRHPLFGNGTASFTYYFEKEQPVPFWSWKLQEPHSQYWLVAAEFGLLGVGALGFLFLSMIQASLRLDKMKTIAFAMLIPFMIGNVSDSLLLYSGSGYFFLLFMALCFGEKLEMTKSKRGQLP